MCLAALPELSFQEGGRGHMGRHRNGTELRCFLPSEALLSSGGDAAQLGRWQVWVFLCEEAGGSFAHDSSQPFLYKDTYKRSMKIAILFQYLIITNLFNGTTLYFFNQTITAQFP